MLPFDLARMTLPELVGLDGQIKGALSVNRDREWAAFRAQLDAVVAQFGMTREDVAAVYGFAAAQRSRKGVKVAVKYRNPQNPRETWTGRGRQPRWLVALLAASHRLEAFLVTPHAGTR